MIISINALSDWFFVTETYSVYCVIWAESLNVTQVNHCLRGLKRCL